MMADSELGTTLITLHCENALCRYLLQRGQRQVVGEVTPGSVARLKCPDCHEIAVYRVPMFAGILTRENQPV